jgi:hypothetical protein
LENITDIRKYALIDELYAIGNRLICFTGVRNGERRVNRERGLYRFGESGVIRIKNEKPKRVGKGAMP